MSTQRGIWLAVDKCNKPSPIDGFQIFFHWRCNIWAAYRLTDNRPYLVGRNVLYPILRDEWHKNVQIDTEHPLQAKTHADWFWFKTWFKNRVIGKIKKWLWKADRVLRAATLNN